MLEYRMNAFFHSLSENGDRKGLAYIITPLSGDIRNADGAVQGWNVLKALVLQARAVVGDPNYDDHAVNDPRYLFKYNLNGYNVEGKHMFRDLFPRMYTLEADALVASNPVFSGTERLTVLLSPEELSQRQKRSGTVEPEKTEHQKVGILSDLFVQFRGYPRGPTTVE